MIRFCNCKLSKLWINSFLCFFVILILLLAFAKYGQGKEPKEELPACVQVFVKWKIDIAGGSAINKGHMNLNIKGTLKLEPMGTPELKTTPSLFPIQQYDTDAITVNYSYSETHIQKEPDPEGCTPIVEEYNGSGSFSLGSGSGLYIRKISSMISGDKQKIPIEGFSEGAGLFDYYEFIAGGPSSRETIYGEKRPWDKCIFKQTEKDINLCKLGIRFQIPKDGKMIGNRSWSTKTETAAPSFHINLSDLPEPMSKADYKPENIPGGDVDYIVNWTFGEVEPGIRIHMDVDGNWVDITNQTQTVTVGERIKLWAQVIPASEDPKEGEWNIPEMEKVVQDFSVEDFIQNNKDGCKTKIDRLEDDELNKPDISFYWWDSPGKEITVSYTTTVKGKQLTGEAKIIVKKPPLKIKTEIPKGGFHYLLIQDKTGKREEIGYDPDNKSKDYSVRFFHDPLNAEFSGHTQWVQLVSLSGKRIEHVYGGAKIKVTDCKEVSIEGLDTSYPYREGIEMSDRPGVELGIYELHVQMKLEFSTYLMYRPDKEHAIFVPLKVVDWEWYGEISRKDPTIAWIDKDISKSSHVSIIKKDNSPIDYPEWKNICPDPPPWEKCKNK